jgi:DNA mismatch endonuclease, patch repair protein
MKNDERSRTMRAVRSTDTGPELLVRHLVHQLGYRFRLHRKDLAGKPDLVFPSRRKVIFVHGCFWHGHDCKRGARVPKANRAYWTSKIRRNATRDAEQLLSLKADGWRILVLWECALKNRARLGRRLERFLGPKKLSACLS